MGQEPTPAATPNTHWRCAMAKLHYRVLRGAAIIFGAGLTGYSAWLSWSHHMDPVGPIAAVTGALLFVFAEHAWVDRRPIRFVLMLGLATMALSISGLQVY